MKPYRILLAEDHTLFRELIKNNLELIPDLKVVGEVGDGLQLLDSIKILKPHMVILDIGMPGLSGIEAAKIIKHKYPKIKILLLTMFKSEDHLEHALKANVDGYLLKENAFKDLITAINMIRDGDKYISTIMLQKISEYIRQEPSDMASISGDPTNNTSDIHDNRQDITLTPREIEILTYFAQGKTLRKIAELLSIIYFTIKDHIITIKFKLNIKKNVDLIQYALHNNYTSISK